MNSGASLNIFCNGNLIKDIQFLDHSTSVATGGSKLVSYNKIGKLSLLLWKFSLPMEDYYYHENMVVNLQSLGKITKEFRALFDSAIDDKF